MSNVHYLKDTEDVLNHFRAKDLSELLVEIINLTKSMKEPLAAYSMSDLIKQIQIRVKAIEYYHYHEEIITK